MQKRACWCLPMKTRIIPKVSAASDDFDNFGILHHQNFLHQLVVVKQCHARVTTLLTTPALEPSHSSSSCWKHGFLKLSDQSGTPQLLYHYQQSVALGYCLLCLLNFYSVVTEIHSGPQGLLHLFNFMKLVSLKWSKKQAQV